MTDQGINRTKDKTKYFRQKLKGNSQKNISVVIVRQEMMKGLDKTPTVGMKEGETGLGRYL